MISQTNAAQEMSTGLTAGLLAAAVAYLGDDTPNPGRLALAFLGGFIVGSRRVTVQSVDQPLPDPVLQ